MKRVLILGSLILLTSGVVGCKANPIKNITDKLDRETQIAYYIDNSSGELKTHLAYNKIGRLIEISLPNRIETDVDTEIYVRTNTDVYSATIVEDKLIYIGQSPDEGNPIIDVYYVKIENTVIKKEELTDKGESFEFRYPVKNVNGISLDLGKESFTEITIEGNEFVIIIPKEICNNTNEFVFVVRKNIKIEI